MGENNLTFEEIAATDDEIQMALSFSKEFNAFAEEYQADTVGYSEASSKCFVYSNTYPDGLNVFTNLAEILEQVLAPFDDRFRYLIVARLDDGSFKFHGDVDKMKGFAEEFEGMLFHEFYLDYKAKKELEASTGREGAVSQAFGR